MKCNTPSHKGKVDKLQTNHYKFKLPYSILNEILILNERIREKICNVYIKQKD